jgi:uncharacterized protein (DUF1684 family)
MSKALIAASIFAFALGAGDTYQHDEEQWRAHHQSELAKDYGWLTVVGLDWLKEGDNRVGADPASEVPLPSGSAPQRVAIKDNDCAARKHFQGLSWYPVDRSWRIQAKFTSWPAPHSLKFYNTIGQEETEPSPGYVTFQKEGHEFRLEPMLDDGMLFFVLRDQTSGKTTYGASRFLYADPAKDGVAWLDFNQAENPPCAFTAYATCPLPPPQNRLALPITAGEKKYAGSAH